MSRPNKIDSLSTVVDNPVERFDRQNDFCEQLKKCEQTNTPVDVILSVEMRIALLVKVKETDTVA